MADPPSRFVTGLLNALGALPVMYPTGGADGGDKVFGGENGRLLSRPGFRLGQRQPGQHIPPPAVPPGPHGYSRGPGHAYADSPDYEAFVRELTNELFRSSFNNKYSMASARR